MKTLDERSTKVEGWSVPSRSVRRHQIPDRLQEVRQTADWDMPEALYRQIAQIARDSEITQIPDNIVGRFAESIAEIAPCYQDREELLVLHTQAVFGEVDGHEAFDDALFELLYADDRITRFHPYQSARRRPTPFEAVVETCRRLRDARAVRDALSGIPMSGILGGSASYGQFYNVRGHSQLQDASDLDMVMVVDNAAVLADVADQLQGVRGIDKSSVNGLRHRIKVFTRTFDNEQTALSHKLMMWNHCPDLIMPASRKQSQYQLSVHFLTRPVLDYILAGASTKLTCGSVGRKRTVRDYRDTLTGRKDHQRTFAGNGYPMELDTTVTTAGFLRTSNIYYIDEADAYCPGLFQNILLPRSEILWDDLLIRNDLAMFRSKVLGRLRYERKQRPHSLLRLSLSHPRREFFAPHIVHEIDSDISLN